MFAVSVEAAGLIGNNVIGKPQHVFTSEIEDRIANTLFERCALRCDSRATPIPQPIIAFLSVDRLSRQFVVVPAGPVTTIDAAAYKECWATYLGLPSPACTAHMDTPFTDCRHRRRLVDIYGHSVNAARRSVEETPRQRQTSAQKSVSLVWVSTRHGGC